LRSASKPYRGEDGENFCAVPLKFRFELVQVFLSRSQPGAQAGRMMPSGAAVLHVSGLRSVYCCKVLQIGCDSDIGAAMGCERCERRRFSFGAERERGRGLRRRSSRIEKKKFVENTAASARVHIVELPSRSTFRMSGRPTSSSTDGKSMRPFLVFDADDSTPTFCSLRAFGEFSGSAVNTSSHRREFDTIRRSSERAQPRIKNDAQQPLRRGRPLQSV